MSGQPPSIPPDSDAMSPEASPPDAERAAPSDGALIALAASGDLDAFNVIVERYERAVFAASWRILRDPLLAEDAAQDTFIRAWNAVGSFQGDNAKSWLLRIATNRCLDLIRQRARQAISSLDEQLTEQEPRWSSLSPQELPDREAENAELSNRLETAMALLPDDQRVAIVLADAMGYDYSEVAEITGSAIGTVKSRISRGRTRLRAILLNDPSAREHFLHLIRQDE
jgi:RNA polymerase sigma-70 factor (ECF subfamily)